MNGTWPTVWTTPSLRIHLKPNIFIDRHTLSLFIKPIKRQTSAVSVCQYSITWRPVIPFSISCASTRWKILALSFSTFHLCAKICRHQLFFLLRVLANYPKSWKIKNIFYTHTHNSNKENLGTSWIDFLTIDTHKKSYSKTLPKKKTNPTNQNKANLTKNRYQTVDSTLSLINWFDNDKKTNSWALEKRASTTALLGKT